MSVPKVPKYLRMPSVWERWKEELSKTFNFYRVHMICFTCIPLVLSGIMFAANGKIRIAYIDCLFLCVSCMCVTGLATVNLSSLTVFQQFLLYFQMLIGSTIFVSLLMVSVRKHFFRQKFRHVLKEREKRNLGFSLSRTLSRFPTTTAGLRRRFTRQPQQPQDVNNEKPPSRPASVKKKKLRNINKDMIKRIDGGGVGLVNPMGWYEEHSAPRSPVGTPETNGRTSEDSIRERAMAQNQGADPVKLKVSLEKQLSQSSSPSTSGGTPSDDAIVLSSSSSDLEQPKTPYGDTGITIRRFNTTDTTNTNDTNRSSVSESPKVGVDHVDTASGTHSELAASNKTPYIRTPYANRELTDDAFPRAKTIVFDEPDDGFDHRMYAQQTGNNLFPNTPTMTSDIRFPRTMTSGSGPGFPRTHSLRPQTSRLVDTKNSGFGGFPTPLELAGDLVGRIFPKAKEGLKHTMTMPRTNTISGRDSLTNTDNGVNRVPYISFDAVVGRNSRFQDLTEEQMDELGGVEYRALKILFWIVLTYWVCLPLIGVIIIAPYIDAGDRYSYVFNTEPVDGTQNVMRHIGIPWFSFFQCTSAFSNTGMSLVDTSMVPFQRAYLLATVCALLILLGNTCFPIALRFIIWSMAKVVPTRSATHESLKFLLDHPRRCYIYLFPSTHTWFLLLIVVTLTTIDWVSFLVLDEGTPSIEAIPVGTRVAAAAFQSAAVRAAGFVIVNMNTLAPAVKVLYVIMMYISVYPIAMSVRSTNVYEEQSLGLFEDEVEEEEPEAKDVGATAVVKYLGWHARRQLAFDMWWIALALWIICIIERGKLNNPDNYGWMNVFNLLFEVVSGYGTVGLSLGVPYDNYSLSGSFRRLSKVVMIVVMLRGRHRGLPVAIDRAVMLPNDFTEQEEMAFEDRLRRSRSRRASTLNGEMLSQNGSQFVPQSMSQLPHTFSAGSVRPADMQPPVAPNTSPTIPPVLAPRRRDSSPEAITRRHSRTFSNSSNTVSPDTLPAHPTTPTTLSFALPSVGQTLDRSPVMSAHTSASLGFSSLSPVPEIPRPAMSEEPAPMTAAEMASISRKDKDV